MEVVKLPDNRARQMQLQSLSKLEKLNLQPYEKKVLELKYQSLPFSKMSAAEIKVSATRLLLKISFITGWSLYEDDTSQGILKEQFELKIKESYPLVNVEEMEYAFRNNTTVKDWGKVMNLAMIDEVMIPYLNQRRELSDIEENLHKPQLPEPQKEDILSDEDFIEANRSVYKITGKYGLISTRCYDILVKQGKIGLTQEEKEKIKKFVTGNFFSSDNQDNKNLTHDQKERFITQDCKKIAVSQYFTILTPTQ